MSEVIVKLNKENRKRLKNGVIKDIIRFSRTIKDPSDLLLDMIVNAAGYLAAEEIQRERDVLYTAIMNTKGIGEKRAEILLNNIEILKESGHKDCSNDD